MKHQRSTLKHGDHGEPIRLSALLEHHQGELEEMKRLLQDSPVLKSLQEESDRADFQPETDDVFLLRFLLNPKYTVQEATERFIKMLKYRNERRLKLQSHYQTFHQLVQNAPFHGQAALPHARKVFDSIPERLLHFHDHWGQPVALQCVGRSSLSSFLQNCTAEEFEDYALAKSEYMRLYIDYQSRQTDQLVQ